MLMINFPLTFKADRTKTVSQWKSTGGIRTGGSVFPSQQLTTKLNQWPNLSTPNPKSEVPTSVARPKIPILG
jgi:hypothetical protein